MIQEILKRFGLIKELVGRAKYAVNTMMWRRPMRPTVDLTRVDYAFYDKLRRGMASGLAVAGLIVKPICSKIAAWSMGRPLQFRVENEASEAALNGWWKKNYAKILRAFEDSLGLGDMFVIMNGDGTISVVAPDVVQPIVDDSDYGKVIGWAVVQRRSHPTDLGRHMIETNEYYADRRVRTVEFENRAPSTQTFRNLLGVIPVIHIANNINGNQEWGVPELEALTASTDGALYRYDDILDAAITGNILKGRPTPAIKFNDIPSLNDFWDRYATRTTDSETDESYYEIHFDSDKLLGIVGDFEYKSPGASAGEAKILLELIYWLIVEHCEIPDIMLGTEMGSARASGQVQVEPLVRFIEKKRGQAEWVSQLADVAMRWLALTEPGVSYEEPSVMWESLVQDDNTLKQTVVAWALLEGLITDETALRLAPIISHEIEDIDAEVAQARKVREESQRQQEVDFDKALEEAAANADKNPDPEVV